MAIFHLSVKVFSRSHGHSAVAAASYRAGADLLDERDGVLHTYAKRAGVLREESLLILPEGAPAWNRATLWNAAEKAEKRKNSCVGREVEASLPWELSQSARVVLAYDFAKWLVEKYEFAAEVNLHEPTPKKDDPRNFHVHIQLSTRKLGVNGFEEKIRVLDAIKTGAPEILKWREEWARRVNEALENNGHDARIDHRSNVDRGLVALPTLHVGNGPRAPEREKLNGEINAWNVEAEALRNEMTRVKAVVAFEEQLAETRRAQEVVKAEEEAQAQARAIEAARAAAEADAQAKAAAAQEAARAAAEAEEQAKAAAEAIEVARAETQVRVDAARVEVAKAAEQAAAKARAEAEAQQAERIAAVAALARSLEMVKAVKIVQKAEQQLAETREALAVINAQAMTIKEKLEQALPARDVRQAREQASKMSSAISDVKAEVKLVREELEQLPWWRVLAKRAKTMQLESGEAQLTVWTSDYREITRTAKAPVRDELVQNQAKLNKEREKLLKVRDDLMQKIAAEEAKMSDLKLVGKLKSDIF